MLAEGDTEEIEYEKIKDELIKIYDCSDLKKFISIIKTILPYRGYSSSHFFTNIINGTQFITKLNFYRKDNPELYGVKSATTVHQNTAEIRILEILKREILDKKKSPCIIRIIYHKDCSGLPILPNKKLCEQYKQASEDNIFQIVQGLFCKHVELIRKGLSNDGFAFVALEKCDITLRFFLKKYLNNSLEGVVIFKSILFQIIYTLYTITKRYPSFKHYDLHTDNIMLKFDANYSFNPMDLKFLIYKDEKMHWAIPYFGIQPKIIDFGFSMIEEEGIMSNILDNKQIMNSRPQNDILFLLYDIYDITENVGVEKILDKLDPTKFYNHFDLNYLEENQNKIPSYKQMLNNIIWKEYKNFEVSPSQQYRIYGD